MKIISTIFYTAFIAVIIGVAGLLLGTMLPIPGNIEVKIVKSGSMEPSIPTGSLVVVKPAEFYKKGDIITFGKDTKTEIPTTHRIQDVHSDGTFTTKGDANEEADQNPVAQRDVIGAVAFHVPYAGFILDFARQPLGFTLLVAVPAGLVILEELVVIFQEMRKWRRNRGNGGGSGGGGTLDLRSHLKMVYSRRRHMDEIFVPTYLAPRFLSGAWFKYKLGLHNDAYGTATMLVMGLVFVSGALSGESGGTIAYFHDIERSIGNFFAAGQGDGWPLTLAQQEEQDLMMLSLEAPPEEGTVLGTTTEEETTEEETPEPTDAPADSGTPVEPPPKEEPTEPLPDPSAAQTAPIEPQTPAEPVEPPAEPEPQPEPTTEPQEEIAPVVE